MIFIRIFLLTIFVNLSNNLLSQDLTRHRWENRLIVIFSQDFDDPNLRSQLNEFNNFRPGLDERKVLVYQIIPGKFKQGLSDQHKWEAASADLFSKYKSTESSFEVLLIGLDGGVKLRKNESISCEELFRIIDSMPMRRREIERQDRNQR